MFRLKVEWIASTGRSWSHVLKGRNLFLLAWDMESWNGLSTLIMQLQFLSLCLLQVEWLWDQLMVVYQRKGESTQYWLSLCTLLLLHSSCATKGRVYFLLTLSFCPVLLFGHHMFEMFVVCRGNCDICRFITNSAQVSVSREGGLLSLQMQTHHSYYQNMSGIVKEKELEVDLSETFKTLLKHGNRHEESVLWGTDMTLHLLRVCYNSTYYAI